MRIPGDIRFTDILYTIMHAGLWIIGLLLVAELSRGSGKELAYGLIAGWFASLYLTVFYPVRWQSWFLGMGLYFAFGVTYEYFDTYIFFHLDTMDVYNIYTVILLHAAVFGSPILVAKGFFGAFGGKKA